MLEHILNGLFFISVKGHIVGEIKNYIPIAQVLCGVANSAVYVGKGDFFIVIIYRKEGERIAAVFLQAMILNLFILPCVRATSFYDVSIRIVCIYPRAFFVVRGRLFVVGVTPAGNHSQSLNENNSEKHRYR